MSFNYMKLYCERLAKTEVPPRFTRWCAIASLLAALERRIFIRQGIYTIYPNFYMVLVAASGQKKSTAINLVGKLLRRLSPPPTVVSQKITPEALIAALQTTNTDEGLLTLKTSCGGIVIADELATFLDKSALDRGLGPILTALYDCTPFEYATKKDGIQTIDDGYLSILGGTTIELLRNSLPKDAIGGGFTSRTMFVYEDQLSPPVAWIDYDPRMDEIEQECVNYLQRLMELKGPVELTPDAKEFYIKDYNDRYNDTVRVRDPLLASYENRRHAHMLKLAMAIMVCESPRLKMDWTDIRGAKVILEEAEEYLSRVMQLVVSTEVGLTANQIYIYIQQRGVVRRAELVRHFSTQMTSEELMKQMDTLIQGQRVKIDSSPTGIIYKDLSRGAA